MPNLVAVPLISNAGWSNSISPSLRKVPIIDLKMRIGEASGAAVVTLLVRAAFALHNGMATFDEAGAKRNNAP